MSGKLESVGTPITQTTTTKATKGIQVTNADDDEFENEAEPYWPEDDQTGMRMDDDQFKQLTDVLKNIERMLGGVVIAIIVLAIALTNPFDR